MEKLQEHIAFPFPFPFLTSSARANQNQITKTSRITVPKIHVRLYLGIQRRGDEQDKCASGRASKTSRVLPQLNLAAFVLGIRHSGTI